ncbi:MULTISPECIES: YdcF family protein [unclassified Roseitalea]|uniref:YdcF family protein n=1 Tax=unclassified Roseitalea TaxID=2639107 RepID=UPI00273FCEEF|nr:MULTISPECIES: YdcF family protein [unclassified Roseitalea]
MDGLFFIVSKIGWFAVQPVSIVLILMLAGLGALAFGWVRLTGAAFVLALAVLYLGAFTTLGEMAMARLEDRHPAEPDLEAAQVKAIVVLGGGFSGEVTAGRGGFALNGSGDRFVEAAMLAREHPEAVVIVSGGDASLLGAGESDAVIARRFFARLGLPAERLIVEGRSRNTHENAMFTEPLVAGLGGEGAVLLVTSAFHMPRALAVFERAGMAVIAWPTDFRTPAAVGFRPFNDDPVGALAHLSTALREHLGLLVYRLTGRA